MQQDLPVEERLYLIEARLNELERKAREQSSIDAALLSRIDGFIEDIRLIRPVSVFLTEKYYVPYNYV